MASSDDTSAEFFFPPGATAPLAERVNRAIIGSDARQALRPYCFVLDTFVRAAPQPGRDLGEPSGAYARLAARRQSRRREGGPSSWRGDVVIVGECAGRAELEFTARLIDGVARTGRSILYLSISGEETRFLHDRRKNSGPRARVAILELPALSHAREFWLRPEAYAQYAEDRRLLDPVLRVAGAWLRCDALPALCRAALAKTVWRAIRENIDARALIACTNYRPLSAVLLAEAEETDRLSVCFQHSVVTCPGSFVPIPAKRFGAFGAASRALLDRLDAEFAGAAGRARLCREIVPLGSLVDPIAPIENASTGDLLVIDSGEGFAPRFLGTEEEYSALESTVRVLAEGIPRGRSVVVRAHPRGGAGRWRSLERRSGGRIKISTGRALAEDLGSAALAVGLFSTVLPAAAASGLPVFFLWQPGWFWTPDLAPFAPDHRADPDSLPARVFELLGSESLYARARLSARAAAEHYFAGLRRCEFDPPIVESLLAPLR